MTFWYTLYVLLCSFTFIRSMQIETANWQADWSIALRHNTPHFTRNRWAYHYINIRRLIMNELYLQRSILPGRIFPLSSHDTCICVYISAHTHTHISINVGCGNAMQNDSRKNEKWLRCITKYINTRKKSLQTPPPPPPPPLLIQNLRIHSQTVLYQWLNCQLIYKT